MKDLLNVVLLCFILFTALACDSAEEEPGCITGVWSDSYSSSLGVRITGEFTNYQEIQSGTHGNTFGYIFRGVPVDDYFLECGSVRSGAWWGTVRSVTIGVLGGQTTRLNCNRVWAMPPTEGPYYEDGCHR